MNDMKCPFCGHKLGCKNTNDIMCSNEKCATWKGNFYGSEELWQELITTRKALDKAIDLLKMLYSDYNLDWAVVDSDKVYDFLKQIKDNNKE